MYSFPELDLDVSSLPASYGVYSGLYFEPQLNAVENASIRLSNASAHREEQRYDCVIDMSNKLDESEQQVSRAEKNESSAFVEESKVSQTSANGRGEHNNYKGDEFHLTSKSENAVFYAEASNYIESNDAKLNYQGSTNLKVNYEDLSNDAKLNYEDSSNFIDPSCAAANYIESNDAKSNDEDANNYVEEATAKSKNVAVYVDESNVVSSNLPVGSYVENDDNPKPPAAAAARPPPVRFSSASFPSRDWLSEYLSHLDAWEALGSLSVASVLAEFVDEFTSTAVALSRIIVEERDLDDSFKSIKPLRGASGVAGGVKFAAGGIFFKVALDEHGLYGGSHRLAGKVASREILATNYLIHAHSRCVLADSLPVKVRFPLCCVVIHRGVSILCSCTLPINDKTLVYGSQDGGVTVHADDPLFNEAAKALGERLYLKEHLCGGRLLNLAADVEGHRVPDGSYYVVLDTARCFPPELLPKEQRYRGWHLVALLRPDLLSLLQKPVSSDALSGFQASDPRADEHNSEVREMTVKLDHVVEKFYSRLRLPLPSTVEEIEVFIGELHLFGLNVRHLGRLRNVAVKRANNSWAEFLLVEVVSRACKNVVRDWMISNPKLSVSDCLRRLRADPSAIKRVREMLKVFFPSLVVADGPLLSDSVLRRTQALCPDEPKVKHLFIFRYFEAFSAVESNAGSASVEDAVVAIEKYSEALRSFSGSDHVWMNFGVSIVECARKVVGAGRLLELKSLLDQADHAFDVAYELQKIRGKIESLLLMNWAGVARLRGQYLGDPLGPQTMEERIRKAWEIERTDYNLSSGAYMLGLKAVSARPKDEVLLREAIDILESLPSTFSARNNDLATLCFLDGQLDRALELFRLVAEGDDPNFVGNALYFCADICLAKGDFDECIRFSQKCLDSNASFVKAKFVMARCHLANNKLAPQQYFERLKLALDLLQDTIDYSPADSFFLIGLCQKAVFALTQNAIVAQMQYESFCRASQFGRLECERLAAIAAVDCANTDLTWSNYVCDAKCGRAMGSDRFHCDTCGDYDLCSLCFEANGHPHQMVQLSKRNHWAQISLSHFLKYFSATKLPSCLPNPEAAEAITLLFPFLHAKFLEQEGLENAVNALSEEQQKEDEIDKLKRVVQNKK